MEKVRVVIQRNKKIHWPWIIFLSDTRKSYHFSGQNGFYEKAWPGSGDHLKMPVEQLLLEDCELVSDTIIEVANLPEHFPFGFPLIHESGIQNEWNPAADEECEFIAEDNTVDSKLRGCFGFWLSGIFPHSPFCGSFFVPTPFQSPFSAQEPRSP